MGERGKGKRLGTAGERKERFERDAANSRVPTYIFFFSKDDRFLEVFILELMFCVSSGPPVSCVLPARILLAAMRQGCGKWPSVIKTYFFILKQSIDDRIL